jgi:hypothetical protein
MTGTRCSRPSVCRWCNCLASIQPAAANGARLSGAASATTARAALLHGAWRGVRNMFSSPTMKVFVRRPTVERYSIGTPPPHTPWDPTLTPPWGPTPIVESYSIEGCSTRRTTPGDRRRDRNARRRSSSRARSLRSSRRLTRRCLTNTTTRGARRLSSCNGAAFLESYFWRCMPRCAARRCMGMLGGLLRFSTCAVRAVAAAPEPLRSGWMGDASKGAPGPAGPCMCAGLTFPCTRHARLYLSFIVSQLARAKSRWKVERTIGLWEATRRTQRHAPARRTLCALSLCR